MSTYIEYPPNHLMTLEDWFTEFNAPYSVYPGESFVVCSGKFKDIAIDEWWISQSFFLRLTDRDTSEKLIETATITMFKGTEATFGRGLHNPMSEEVFTKVMPNKILNLRLELVEWFLLSAEGASFREQIRAYADFTVLKSDLPSIPPPPPPETGKAHIYGLVYDQKTFIPIAGAKVSVDGISQYTDARGSFQFLNLSLGTYTFTVEIKGYTTYSTQIGLTVTGEVQYQVPMSKGFNVSWNIVIPVAAVATVAGVMMYGTSVRKKV